MPRWSALCSMVAVLLLSGWSGCEKLLPFGRRDGTISRRDRGEPDRPAADLVADDAGRLERGTTDARRREARPPDGPPPDAAPVSPGWLKTAGGTLADVGVTVALDGAGNSFVAAYVQGSVDLGGGVLPNQGSYDVALASYKPDGSHRWSVSFGSASDDYPRALAVDASGNSYLAGFFAGPMTVKGTTAASVSLAGSGNFDAFLASFDPGGALRWARGFGSSTDDRAYGTAVDGSGHVFLTGHIGAAVDFGSGVVSAGAFLASFNAASGSCAWSRSFSSPSGEDWGYWATVDASGNITITGYISGSVDFGGGAVAAPGQTDAFVASFSPGGAHRWSKGFGSKSSDGGHAVAADSSGNLYVTGFVQGSTDFGGGAVAGIGGEDLFLASFTAAGGYRWAKVFGSSAADVGRCVAVAAGNVYLVGYGGAVNFGGGALPCGGADDILLASFVSSTGAHRWSQSFGAAGSDEGHGVAALGGDLAVTGQFAQTVDFGYPPPRTSKGSQDLFLLKAPLK